MRSKLFKSQNVWNRTVLKSELSKVPILGFSRFGRSVFGHSLYVSSGESKLSKCRRCSTACANICQTHGSTFARPPLDIFRRKRRQLNTLYKVEARPRVSDTCNNVSNCSSSMSCEWRLLRRSNIHRRQCRATLWRDALSRRCNGLQERQRRWSIFHVFVDKMGNFDRIFDRML